MSDDGQNQMSNEDEDSQNSKEEIIEEDDQDSIEGKDQSPDVSPLMEMPAQGEVDIEDEEVTQTIKEKDETPSKNNTMVHMQQLLQSKEDGAVMDEDQLKFLDMLQQSKGKKPFPRPLKTLKSSSKHRRIKTKSQNQNRARPGQRLNEINEGDESNEEERLGQSTYQSESQHKIIGVLQQREEDEMNDDLKDLLLKIEKPS